MAFRNLNKRLNYSLFLVEHFRLFFFAGKIFDEKQLNHKRIT